MNSRVCHYMMLWNWACIERNELKQATDIVCQNPTEAYRGIQRHTEVVFMKSGASAACHLYINALHASRCDITDEKSIEELSYDSFAVRR